MANIYDMADTWNDSGTVFTALKMNVTDTASAAGSRIFDFQVDGTSKVWSDKDGRVYLESINAVRASSVSNKVILGSTSFNNAVVASPGLLQLSGTARIGFSTTQSAVVGPDLYLEQDAANTFAQRNGTNPQEFRLYNTYTNSTDYERGFIKWEGNALKIGMEADGTGTNRSVSFVCGTTAFFFNTGSVSFTRNIQSDTSNLYDCGLSNRRWRNVFVGTSIDNTGYEQFTEMTAPSAPSADAVRIYAEDNGSGKTRLMALFPTGAAQQIAIEP